MAYNSKAIANYFLDIAEKEGDTSITPMKVQKLVYYAHGWHLAIYGRPLIHEQIEAWKYGPVIESLFHTFKIYGKDQITEKAKRYQFPEVQPGEDVNDLLENVRVYEPSLEDDENTDEDPSETAVFLDQVWEIYGKYSGTRLSNMTHTPGSPWSVVSEKYEGDPPKGTDIPREIIEEYFTKMGSTAEASH
ncbi:Panacea domain-containing protein [Gimesia sp.]|uniref:Panacea domain-containing protein n=1 Tax=Gimesia sp. TaxID=2024833 RepID=UPI003A934E7C